LRTWRLPRAGELGLIRVGNDAGLDVSVLPNGAVFAIEHRDDRGAIRINQVPGAPIGGGIARVLLRARAAGRAATCEVQGPRARVWLGHADDRIVWEGRTRGIAHRVTLRLLPAESAWLWRIDVTNAGDVAMQTDAILVQDLGLGAPEFVANNEAYASQYIDHHAARDARLGPVVLSRQNLAQQNRHPWVMHGCLDGAEGFATDAMQLFGPAYRDANALPLPTGNALANRRLQHEVACAAIQSRCVTLQPGAGASWRFFALYEADHPAASSDADLAKLFAIEWPADDAHPVATSRARRDVVQDAPAMRVKTLDADALAKRYPDRFLEESKRNRPLSFFAPDPPHNRHVVLRAKERIVTRRHGALVRSGSAMLPHQSTLCATCWMHGVFAAQLTIGNTSFHKLFGVSRDPYNVMRASGLRAMVDAGRGWRLLTIPSAFEMGLSDCRWIYVLAERVVTVRAVVSGADPAMQWRIVIDGAPCRILVYGQLVIGEREFEHAGNVVVDQARASFTFRPDPESLFGRHYPDAAYHLVISTPDAIDAIGGDELLLADEEPRSGTHLAIRTQPTNELVFAVVGSLTDPAHAAELASKYERPRDDDDVRSSSMRFWTHVTRGTRIGGDSSATAALNASLPWLAHDAMMHLTVPRGLEQYTGAAWGTRDVCQGPVECLLALEHDACVREILRIVFAEQYAARGDWPQWFMLEPYSSIRDAHSHGDVIVWPLKALNDYLEATNDLAFLDERAAWRDDATLARTASADPISVHVEKLLAKVQERFIPGTRLVRYGEGDWNDSLQPADPGLRDAMVSSWTVALLYQQLERYGEALRRAGRAGAANGIADLALGIRHDFNRFLVRDRTVAGYAVFGGKAGEPELLLHPSDVRTGLRYSLLPMTRSIIAGLFTSEQAHHHLRIIREHLLFPDGVRLMDQPVGYRGGVERIFRRAESAAFFGREIGLMYVHAHLRYGEAMAALGEADALWDALAVANPIGVTTRVTNAAPRQRNAYFSSSDAAFDDRYEASAEWARVKAGTVPVEGGWRIYSSGPGLYINLLVCHALGVRRRFGDRVRQPALPQALRALTVERDTR